MAILDLLKEALDKENVLANEDMSKHTSFKTGGKADFFVKIDSADKLKAVLEIAKNANLPILILGNRK